MRFNIKDLFGVTVLLAFYLSAVLYAIQYTDLSAITDNLGLSIIVGVAHVVIYGGTYFLMRLRTAPYEFEFDGGVPWGPVLTSVVLMWFIAVIGRWLPEGVFFVLSFPFVTLAVMVLIFRRAYVSAKAICYLMPFPWSKVHVTTDEENALRLRLGAAWLGLSVEVPSKFQQRVKELIANAPRSQAEFDERVLKKSHPEE